MLEKYQITSPTMVLILEGGRHVSYMVPTGAVITIEGKTFNGNTLVEVLWAGQTVMMFTQDLRSRGLKIE
jgi:hypothetical protein